MKTIDVTFRPSQVSAPPKPPVDITAPSADQKKPSRKAESEADKSDDKKTAKK